MPHTFSELFYLLYFITISDWLLYQNLACLIPEMPKGRFRDCKWSPRFLADPDFILSPP